MLLPNLYQSELIDDDGPINDRCKMPTIPFLPSSISFGLIVLIKCSAVHWKVGMTEQAAAQGVFRNRSPVKWTHGARRTPLDVERG